MTIRLSLALWVLPLSWAIHDIEEILTMVRWLQRHEADLDALVVRVPVAHRFIAAAPTTTREFVLAVGIVGIVFVGGTVLGMLDPHGIGRFVYATLLGGYCLHAIIHVAQAGLVRGYAPGVVTAVVLIPPTAGYLYQRLFTAGLLTPRLAVLTAIVGVLLLVPLLMFANTFASTMMSE